MEKWGLSVETRHHPGLPCIQPCGLCRITRLLRWILTSLQKKNIKLWSHEINTLWNEGRHVQKLFKIHYCHLTFFHPPLWNTPGESYVRSSQHSQRRWDCTAQIILLRKRIPQNVFPSNEVTMMKCFVHHVKDKTTPMKPLCSFDRRSSVCIS